MKSTPPQLSIQRADEIRTLHGEIINNLRSSLDKAIRIGELLSEQKDSLRHGEFTPWITENLPFSDRTARNYMRCYQERGRLKTETVSDLKEAYQLLTEYKPQVGTPPEVSSKENEWYTPKKYINAVHDVMRGIDLDPASCVEANKVIKAKRIFTKEKNGLEKHWSGRIFLNPPYGKECPLFIRKLCGDLKSGYTKEAIVLVNSSSTDAEWFQPLFDGILCFTNHRIEFSSMPNSTHGSVFVYFGPNKERFAKVFSKFGNVVRRC